MFVKKKLLSKIVIWKIKNAKGEYRGVTYSICNLKYNAPKKIPIVFHNGSNYDYQYIINELAE